MALAGKIDLYIIFVLMALLSCFAAAAALLVASFFGDERATVEGGSNLTAFGLAILVFLLSECLGYLWGKKSIDYKHWLELKVENTRLQQKVDELSRQLLSLEEKHGAASSSTIQKIVTAGHIMPTEILVAKNSMVYHVDCHHVRRRGAQFTKLRPCLDCAGRNLK